MTLIIGLTGKRHVGKTTAANHLVAAHGFARVHPFAGGKVAAAAYFRHLGASEDDAERMVHGDLRDKPSPYLPGNACPRTFLERFGRFMGVDLGPDWTLAREIEIARRREPTRPLVVESVVYEADVIRSAGGILVRIVRPGHVGPEGVASDAAQAGLAVDATIFNDGNLARLRRQVDQIVMNCARRIG